MNSDKYMKITKTFSYTELCLLESALNEFNPDYAKNDTTLKELKENVTAARGWVHHYNKTDREDV